MPERRADVLMVGGGVASVRCARSLRRHGFAGSILLLADEPHLPYNRPPLSKEVLRGDVSFDLLLAEGEAWYERRAIEVRTGAPVASIDRERRVAWLADGESVAYGQLLLATGAGPRRPPIPGGDGARTLRTVDDAVAIRAAVGPGSRVVIVGGGFIGVEVAASLAAAGAQVSVIEIGDRLWGGSLGEELSAWAAASLENDGVALRFGAAVTEIRDGSVAIGEEVLPCDLVLLCVGVVPRDDLARASGLPCGDGVVTDAAHRTADEHVFAAGDVALVDGHRIEHWHAAREGGERVALAMLGERPPDRRPAWVFSDFGGRHLDVLGTASGDERIEMVGEVRREPALTAWVGADERVVQLAVTDGALDAERARALVEARATLTRLRREITSGS